MAKVQMLARWSELSVKQNNIDREEAELKRIIGNESEDNGINLYKTEIIHEYGPVVFEMKNVHHYNRAKEKGHTTVHFKNGEVLLLKIPFIDFLEIDVQYSGELINDFVPIDYIDPEDEEMDEESDTDLEL
jgi:hypothetical protein